jgi:hypothetical protein
MHPIRRACRILHPGISGNKLAGEYAQYAMHPDFSPLQIMKTPPE